MIQILQQFLSKCSHWTPSCLLIYEADNKAEETLENSGNFCNFSQFGEHLWPSECLICIKYSRTKNSKKIPPPNTKPNKKTKTKKRSHWNINLERFSQIFCSGQQFHVQLCKLVSFTAYTANKSLLAKLSSPETRSLSELNTLIKYTDKHYKKDTKYKKNGWQISLNMQLFIQYFKI